MKNNTKNNTNKTIKQLFLAASVALTMGVASATSVPGIGTNVFEFSKPGIGATDTITTGPGFDAISNMNNIMDAFGTDVIDQGNFWGSMVSETKQNVFEYTAAAPMIEELVYTVTGEAYGSQQGNATEDWFDATTVQTTTTGQGGNYLTAAEVFATKASNIENNGDYVDGKLTLSRDKAIELMELVGYTVTTTTAPALAGSVNIYDDTSFGGPVEVVDSQGGNHIKDKVIDGSIQTAVGEAVLNRKGFTNANSLIDLIARELKTGYILDVDAATAALDKMATHHTNVLSGKIVAEAVNLKVMIKNIGLQQAGVGLGKGAKDACVVGTGINASVQKSSEACIRVGEEFNQLLLKLPAVANQEGLMDAYEQAVAQIGTFAGDISSFNTTLNGFNHEDTANAIDGQFGTITVNQGSTLYTNLETDSTTRLDADATNDTNLAPTFESITGATESALYAGVSNELDLDGDDIFDLILE